MLFHKLMKCSEALEVNVCLTTTIPDLIFIRTGHFSGLRQGIKDRFKDHLTISFIIKYILVEKYHLDLNDCVICCFNSCPAETGYTLPLQTV